MANNGYRNNDRNGNNNGRSGRDGQGFSGARRNDRAASAPKEDSYLKQNLIQEDLIQERMIQERMIERRTMRQRKILSLLTASMRRSQFQSQKRRKRRQLSSLFYQIHSL